jgi:hypothetical protein
MTQELTENAADLRALADQFTHQRDVNFVIECADTLLSLASERDAAQAEAQALREKLERLMKMWEYDAASPIISRQEKQLLQGCVVDVRNVLVRAALVNPALAPAEGEG